MTNSFSQTIEFTCTKCIQQFTVDIWLIVDTTERPDLLERMKRGDLHEISCPKCGPIGEKDSPVLVFRRDSEPHLLFSPSKHEAKAQNQQSARELVMRLRDSLSTDWQDAWLAEGLPGVERAMLQVALSDNPEAELERLREQAMRQMPVGLREILDELVRSGVEIRSNEDLKRLLDARPDLQEKMKEVVEKEIENHDEIQSNRSGEVSKRSTIDFSKLRQDSRKAQEYKQRYLQTNSLEYLNQAISTWQKILSNPDFGHASEGYQLGVLNNAGADFFERYERLGVC